MHRAVRRPAAPGCAPREHRKGERLQRIAGQDRGGLIKGAMAGRAAAAQVIVIHRRQIIVNQAVGMDQFDCGGRCVESLERRPEGLAGDIDKQRAQAFAAAQDAVAHRLAQALSSGVRQRQTFVEQCSMRA